MVVVEADASVVRFCISACRRDSLSCMAAEWVDSMSLSRPSLACMTDTHKCAGFYHVVVHSNTAPGCEARLTSQADNSKHGSNSNNEILQTKHFSSIITVGFTRRLPVSCTYGGAHLQITVTHLELVVEVCLLDSLVFLQG